MVARSLLDPLLRRLFAPRLALLARKRERYGRVTDPQAIRAFQTDAVNRQWRSALARYSFYRHWQSEHRLPDRIESLAQLADFPLLRKAELAAHADSIAQEASPCRWTTTGGSTGQPVAFPVSAVDQDEFYANMYLGRSWWGIAPFAPMFMLWGHSHLFGTGLGGRVRQWQRRFYDSLIGATRLNAYRLSAADVDRYFSAMDRQPEAVILAYASAFAKILDHVDEHGLVPAYSERRRILLTSEHVFPQDIERIRRHFRIEPVVEYGAAETGVIATSDGRADRLRVLWDSFACQQTGDGELVLTTLWDRHFPLIRYAIGDRARLGEAPADSVLFLSEVLGRSNDALALPLQGGRSISVHSEFFTHIVKSLPAVLSFLIVESGGGIKVRLKLRNGAGLDACRRLALQKIRLEFPDVQEDRITFEPLAEEMRTVAGKHRFIIKE